MNAYNIYDYIDEVTSKEEKSIARAMTRLAINIGQIVLAQEDLNANNASAIRTLVIAAKTYCQEVSVVLSRSSIDRTIVSSTFDLEEHMDLQNQQLFISLLGIPRISDIALSVDIRSSGMRLRIGNIETRVIDTDEVSYLAFIFMAKRIVPKLDYMMREAIRDAKNLSDRLAELCETLGAGATLGRL